MAEDASTMQDVRTGRVEMEITINAPRERVWQAMVEESADWWLPDFYTIKNARFIIEAWPGGRAYEDDGNGNGALWFTVMSVNAPAAIDFSGYLYPAYGGPAVTLITIRLEETEEGATRLKLTDGLLGRFNQEELEHGWPYLFEDGLKKYVESGTRS
jgi:uncharacterized protein YndB with AHSA1/START domain